MSEIRIQKSDGDMLPEIAEAIRIADKHLAGESVERRKALALDISEAIIRHAGFIAANAITKAFDKGPSISTLSGDAKTSARDIEYSNGFSGTPHLWGD